MVVVGVGGVVVDVYVGCVGDIVVGVIAGIVVWC